MRSLAATDCFIDAITLGPLRPCVLLACSNGASHGDTAEVIQYLEPLFTQYGVQVSMSAVACVHQGSGISSKTFMNHTRGSCQVQEGIQ